MDHAQSEGSADGEESSQTSDTVTADIKEGIAGVREADEGELQGGYDNRPASQMSQECDIDPTMKTEAYETPAQEGTSGVSGDSVDMVFRLRTPPRSMMIQRGPLTWQELSDKLKLDGNEVSGYELKDRTTITIGYLQQSSSPTCIGMVANC